MSSLKPLVTSLLFASAALLGGGSWAEEALDRNTMSFKNDVFPILDRRCVECHKPGGEGVEKSGLNLETYEALMKGTTHGPVVAPKDPMVSNLLRLVDGSAKIRMPHNRQRLTDCEIKILHNWIAQGAKNN